MKVARQSAHTHGFYCHPTSASVAVGGAATMTVAVPLNAGLGSYPIPIIGQQATIQIFGSGFSEQRGTVAVSLPPAPAL